METLSKAGACTNLQYVFDIHLSQLVKVSFTPPTVLMTPPGEDVPVAAGAEVPVPVGSDNPVGMAVGKPVGTAVGKPAGTSVGRETCLGNKETLMLAARPPVCFMQLEKGGS